MTKKAKIKKNLNPLPSVTNYPSPLLQASNLTPEEKIDQIADRFKEIMEILGLDLEDESLKKTPYRVARMYVNEIFSGLNLEEFPNISFFGDYYKHETRSNLVLVKVNFTSFCEHHFVPFIGYAYVAYVPNEKIIGLSKIPRIVRFFAKRPQVQERLTAQIADSLSLLLESEDVAVSITAEHFCVKARGIQDENSHTTTNVIRGQFLTDPLRKQEFFEGINRHVND